MTTPLVFTTAAYDYLGRAIAAANQWEIGAIARREFPDGEHYRRIDTDPEDRDVILVGGTIDDAATLELYDLACGLVSGGAYRLRMVIPFFGYATMERSIRAGEIVTAKTRARMLSSIPMASRGTQVFLLDLHVEAVAHYFEGELRPVHVSARSLVTAAARRLGGADFVIACTDAGRAKWVEVARERSARRCRVRVQAPARRRDRGHRSVGAGRGQARRDLRRHDPHRRLAAERGEGVPRCRCDRDRRGRHARPVPRDLARATAP